MVTFVAIIVVVMLAVGMHLADVAGVRDEPKRGEQAVEDVQ